MTTWLRNLLIFAAGVLAGIGGLCTAQWVHTSKGSERVTLTSLSPDETMRVTLVELPHILDRNFELRLEDLRGGSGQARAIFRSPDEGRPEGSERFVWSVDGSRFLLLGRHFHVNAEAPRPSADGDEVAYLMYELPTGRLWCNANQQASHPPFGLHDLQAVRWRNGAGQQAAGKAWGLPQ